MVGASKILTVSYGTFSCTLEGFEEPFSTMKAIAEYFRDLAADDRYFGATPPTPDAEMLHRIAEREVQRRVEARISDQGIVLRPEADDAAPRPVPVAPPAAEAPVAAAERPAIPESVAQKLMRIRAVVSEAKAAAPAAAPADVPYEEDETPAFAGTDGALSTDFGFDLDFGEVPGLKPQEAAAPQAPDDAAAEDGTAPTIAATGDEAAPEPDQAFDEVEDEDAPVAAASEDTAVAGPQDDEEGIVAFAVTEAMDEAAPAEEPAELHAAEEDLPVVAATEADADMAEAGETDAEEAWADEDEDDEWAEAAGDMDAPADIEEPLDLAAFRDEVPEEAAAAEPVAQPSARVIRISRAEEEDFDEEFDDAFDEMEDEGEEPVAAFGTPEDDHIEDRTAAVMAALSDSDYDDAFEDADETAEGDDDAILAQIGAAIGDTGLPEDEEQDLIRDLADASRDIRRDGPEGRAILESATDDDEASVERLMEEAKSKLEGVENRRRFSAIAHLKAAVAATVADRKMKSGDAAVVARSGEPEDDTERYRDDLSKAVRPRRPTSDSMPTTQRPTLATRMAPLVLVSEQRVDLDENEAHAEAGAVIRPRRIRTAVLDDDADDDLAEDQDLAVSPEDARSFAEFAERVGATSLPELLEAAAAYTSTVEGITHFSRPHIMKKVAHMAEDEDYSREDSLRSFGMLLRQGKIQKVRRGQFVLTEASRFVDEARRAAN